VGLAIAGDLVIHFLYRADYWDAGWMMRILAAGGILATINQATGVVWPSLGEFKTITVLMMIQMPLLIAGMYIGGTYFGVVGFVVGATFVELPMFPIQSFLARRRHRLWQPEVDLPVVAVCAALIALGAWLR